MADTQEIKLVNKNNQEACLVKVSNDQALLLIPEMKVANVDSCKWHQSGAESHPLEEHYERCYVAQSWNATKGRYEPHYQLKKSMISKHKSDYAIIHYVGSSEKLNRGPHGNSKDKDQVLMTTNPVVVDNINAIGLAAKPNAIRNELNSTMVAGTLASTTAVRGTSTVKYRQG